MIWTRTARSSAWNSGQFQPTSLSFSVSLPAVRRGSTLPFGKMKRSVMAGALAVGGILAISLTTVSGRRGSGSNEWIRISGPALTDEGDSGGNPQHGLYFTVSNVGQRAVRLQVNVDWMIKDEAPASLNSMTVELVFPAGDTVDTLPLPKSLVSLAYCRVRWWEEPSLWWRLSHDLERQLPFRLWPRRPLIMGEVDAWSSPEPTLDDIMRLRYGVMSHHADPDGPPNGIQPVRPDPKTAATAADFRR
jgi:hypothetical protein